MPISWPPSPSYPSRQLESSSPAFAGSSSSNQSMLPSSSPPIIIRTETNNSPVITSSRVDLNDLASVAANLPQLGPSDTVSLRRDQEQGYFKIALVSPSKKLQLSQEE
ncbi:hypothetical protein GYMLUDRAFT_236010 [Collybiopsis luxurians FD-317 M1]|nr:hypothetical protein GYMLUDRAFT_236010 [Collybiopsis luxurians FD-317 M1]